MKPLIVGIAGGSGSGKTTFANKLFEALGPTVSSIIGQDSYYIDQSDKFDHDGGSVNFDHPSSIDFTLMRQHFLSIKDGQEINVPHYDFATHKRVLEKSDLFIPTPIVFVDGILIFSSKDIIDLFDYKIFIDCPEEVRFERRISRDVKERGRSIDGVKAQIMNQVKPMHDQFVEPSKSNVDDVVGMEVFDDMLAQWSSKLKNLLL